MWLSQTIKLNYYHSNSNYYLKLLKVVISYYDKWSSLNIKMKVVISQNIKREVVISKSDEIMISGEL